MKIENPNQIALFIAACATLMGLTVITLFGWLADVDFPIWFWLFFLILIFGSTFGVAWWGVEKFLHGRIQVLYRSIQSPDQTDQKLKDNSKGRDILGEVQKDVEEWATVKQTEIQTLKEQARFRRDFIGNLAHELKTPIFNMQGYLLTLLEGGLEDPKINYDYLTRADKNLERLIALVEDLDSISKLEAGREVLNPEKFNIVNLFEEVFSLFELRAQEKNIALRFDKKYDRPIYVKGDKGKILQVVSNLVVNAIHYGRFEGFCEVRFFDMSKNILIEIADDGVGVDAEELPRLFERFYRVDKSRSRNQGGTGLGLAICKHIVESHGQTISARSVIGKGTTFSFTLEKSK